MRSQGGFNRAVNRAKETIEERRRKLVNELETVPLSAFMGADMEALMRISDSRGRMYKDRHISRIEKRVAAYKKKQSEHKSS